MSPPSGGRGWHKWAVVLISVAVFASASVAHAYDEEALYTQRNYYEELKPHVVAGITKRLPSGQTVHGYRLSLAAHDGNDHDTGARGSRHRRDTAAKKAAGDAQAADNDLNYYTQGKAAAYLGVPYAQRPIEDRMFRRPVPINFTQSTLSLNQTNRNQPDPCPQNLNGVIVGNKDCLYVNIIAPELEEGDPGFATLYPVMVFFHSGSLKEGGAYVFSPVGIVQNLVRRGMVVVLLQYRIGVYGFMNLRNLIPGIEHNSARGIYDQIQALKWIQNNIGPFRGDKKQVTLAGAGSGACCAALLYYASVTKEGWPVLNGLFQRLILQSGSSDSCRAGGFRSDFHNGTARSSSTEYREVICKGQPTDQGFLECIQAKPFHLLLAETNDQIPYPIFGMDLPDDIIRYSADAAYAASTYKDKARKPIEVLIGMARDEFASYDVNFERRFDMEQNTFRTRMKRMALYVASNYTDANADALIERIQQHYRPEQNVSDDPTSQTSVSYWYDLYVESFTDYLVTSSILLDARRLATLGNRVHLYKIVVTSSPFFHINAFDNSTHPIVPHAIELPYVFMPEHIWYGDLRQQQGTAEMFGQLWYNFVKDGSVKGIGNGTLPVPQFNGAIDLSTGDISSKDKTTGYDMVFDYLYISNYQSSPKKSNAKDAVFIRDGLEEFWTDWKYEQLTHYRPNTTPVDKATKTVGKRRSGNQTSEPSEPHDLAKKHRIERIRSLSEHGSTPVESNG